MVANATQAPSALTFLAVRMAFALSRSLFTILWSSALNGTQTEKTPLAGREASIVANGGDWQQMSHKLSKWLIPSFTPAP